ncbi:MAG TPA: lytic murein transglycosylase, partial [Methylocella sp.]|nr:lytic murein transglycosylase [Methylocella sp.]
SFDAVLVGLTPDPALSAATQTQAEFERPIKAYLGEAISVRRIAQGKALLRQWHLDLSAIENRFGVPAEILIAAFAMESDFGKATGDKDVLRSLATLAYLRPDRPNFQDEFIDALWLLDKGGLPRAALKGSWAGAMGGPQFLPSAYRKYAVRFAGEGAPDIWKDPQDTLASIANFLRQSGWQPGLPWGMEVRLPKDFRFASLHEGFAAFAAEGVKSSTEKPFPQGEATLFLPSGATGPAFLFSANYWILKAYNNSDSYALSLGLLADRIRGAPPLAGHWPEAEVFLSRPQKAEIQQLLARIGFYQGEIDGRFGQASRDAIQAFQIHFGQTPADGFATPELLGKLKEATSQAPPY